VQVVALTVLQVSVVELPEVTELGLALSEITGAAEAIVTVVAWLAVPPAPVQASMNSVVAESVPVLSVPLVASAPPQPPDAMHVVASTELQVSVAEPPGATVVGSAVRVTVGTGVATTTSADCDADPPGPVQVSE
jgi:hypothetical protein